LHGHGWLHLECSQSHYISLSLIMSSKRKPHALSGRPSKGGKHSISPFPCPNPLCSRTYLSNRTLLIHLSKDQVCANALKDHPPLHGVSNCNDTNNHENSGQLKRDTNYPDLSYPEDGGAAGEYDEETSEEDEYKAPWGCLVPWESSEDDSDSTLGDNKQDASVSDCAESQGSDLNPPESNNSEHPLETNSVTRYGISFTSSEYVETKLLKVLNDAHAPHFLYQDVLNWAREANALNYDFMPRRTSRKAQIKHIEKWQQLQYCRPETIQLTLPGDGKVIPVTRFPFVNMLYSLLSDPLFVSDISNLDVNPNDPFGKYQSKDDFLTTVNSGAWYQTAYKNLVKDPNKDFLLPICFACDETKLAKTGKTGCWPLLFSTTIFNQKLRNLSTAWRPLGYLYDLNILDSKAEKKNQSNEYKGERLQAIFRTLLETLIEAQNSGLLDNIPLTFGNQRKIVNIKIAVIFIIGDMQGGDKICCTAASYSNKMSRLCRKCNVRGNQSGDPFVVCKRISMVKVMQLVADNNVDALHSINQYNVHSAWFDVGYGGCRFGIFSAACPVEALHALENGLMSDCLNILFFEEMTGKQRDRLDKLSKKLAALDRQRYLTAGSEPLMPRLRWSDGISSLSDLEAKYRVGIMLTIVVLTLQDDGYALFTEVFGSTARVAQMRQVFQMMLCYWVWLKKDKYWKRGDRAAKQSARVAIQTMLSELMKLWPREKGQGWEKAKVHEQLHVPDDIERNGSPRGWHSGPTENNHIASVKNYASQTNRRRETLDAQIGTRNAESFIIDNAYQKMTMSYDKIPNEIMGEDCVLDGITKNGSKALIFIYKEGRVVTSDVPQWSGLDQGCLNHNLKTFLESHYGEVPSVPMWNGKDRNAHVGVRFSTEYTRGGTIFRAHPNYRQLGSWYDWAMIRWDKEGGHRPPSRSKEDSCVHYGDDVSNPHEFTYAPGMILGFVFDRYPAASPMLENVQAVVLCCDSSHSKSSVFTTHWKVSYVDKAYTQPLITLVNVNAIVRHCLMVPENNDEHGYHEIWSRERWADEFHVT
jgi:hypothetical protein